MMMSTLMSNVKIFDDSPLTYDINTSIQDIMAHVNDRHNSRDNRNPQCGTRKQDPDKPPYIPQPWYEHISEESRAVLRKKKQEFPDGGTGMSRRMVNPHEVHNFLV